LVGNKTAHKGEETTEILGESDFHLFNEGTHRKLYDKLGARRVSIEGSAGVYFAVWAPNASAVSVIGDFNGWQAGKHALRSRGHSGIWDGWFPGLEQGMVYKYHITNRHTGEQLEKADPFAFAAEVPPKSASVIWDLDGYQWGDAEWLRSRKDKQGLSAPISIYEVHTGSWMKVPEEDNRSLSYRELAHKLPEYCRKMGFTHVEFLPIMEHPFYGSWGYQTLGYFAPTSRYGTPQDFMYLVDKLHQAGVGVILDWVPSHFATDGHGLSRFDGSQLFEHADPRQGFHPDWGSFIFNYGRNEVRSFLTSSALFWLDKYHIDGLRVDAVASMLYLDYSRKEGEWIPNQYGGRENLEAVSFLRQMNEAVYAEHPDCQTIAEESTAWPMVSKPTYIGGLGFGLKWDMGWMHDTLKYMKEDPVHRKYHHDRITFRMIYAFHENFVMPLSHDEVVHGKGSLMNQMAGDDWQKFANLRLLYSYMYAQPGKKLLFMSDEFAQWREWNHDSSIDWNLLVYAPHEGMQRLVERLNAVYKEEAALHELDSDPAGFEWVDCNDRDASVLSFLRKSRDGQVVAGVFNFTPVPRNGYALGVPRGGYWKEILNSDAAEYGGSGLGNLGGVEASGEGMHGRPHSLRVTLPPLAAVYFKAP
jgi:1,4-alpha-glucan branching enzyme